MSHSVPLTASVFALDAVLVIVFAALGNRSHDSGLAPADIAATAWPFLVGLTLSWWLAFTWRRPLSLPFGSMTVLGTVGIGMVVRHYLTDGGVQASFVAVATLSLLVLLLAGRLALRFGLRRAVPQALDGT